MMLLMPFFYLWKHINLPAIFTRYGKLASLTFNYSYNMPSSQFDCIIIGGGVIGAFLLRELSRYNIRPLLLEKEAGLAQHATTHNSALVHPAIMVDAGKVPLKARLAEKGNRMYEQVKEELHIPMRYTGALLLAKNEQEKAYLMQKLDDARQRGISDEVALLDRSEVERREANISDSVIAALDMPTTKTSTTMVVAAKITGNAMAHGAEIHKGKEVTSIDEEDGGAAFSLHCSDGSRYSTPMIINAAGAFADKVAAMLEEKPPYTITPRRGEYMVLGKEAGDFMQHTLFSLPTSKGKGVLVIPQPDGTIRLGPTSTPQHSPDDIPVTDDGLSQIKSDLAEMAKNIPYDKVISTYAGVRASSDYNDFYLHNSSVNPRFIHVAGIDSPGVTSAPAIAEYVVENLIQPVVSLSPRTEFDPTLV
jgi:glycerol-3-phosphate dehydrogenase